MALKPLTKIPWSLEKIDFHVGKPRSVLIDNMQELLYKTLS